MKTLYTISLAYFSLLFAACGSPDAQAGRDGVNCWEALGDANQDGVLDAFDCIATDSTWGAPDNSAQRVPGQDGSNPDDAMGGVTDKVGLDGKDGVDGKDGMDGKDGLSLVDEISRVVQSVDTNSLIAVFCDGGYGTGTKTGDGAVITAAHVVFQQLGPMQVQPSPACPDGAILVRITGPGDDDYVLLGSAPASGFDAPIATRDLAVLSNIEWEAEGEALAGIEFLDDWSPTPGELMVVAGFPVGFFDPQISIGFVAADSLESSLDGGTLQFWSEAFTASAATAGGSSGGPVFNGQGSWVAITVGGSSDEGLELGISIPLRF